MADSEDDGLNWEGKLCQKMGLKLSLGNLQLASEFLMAYREEVEQICKEHTESAEWRKAVQDELVVLHILNAENEENPRKALQDIIHWNQKIALDPAVSKEARDLQASGQTILVKFRGRASGSYERTHYDVFINPAKVAYIQGGSYSSSTDVWADGKWFEVSGKVDEVANCLGIVKGSK